MNQNPLIIGAFVAPSDSHRIAVGLPAVKFDGYVSKPANGEWSISSLTERQRLDPDQVQLLFPKQFPAVEYERCVVVIIGSDYSNSDIRKSLSRDLFDKYEAEPCTSDDSPFKGFLISTGKYYLFASAVKAVFEQDLIEAIIDGDVHEIHLALDRLIYSGTLTFDEYLIKRFAVAVYTSDTERVARFWKRILKREIGALARLELERVNQARLQGVKRSVAEEAEHVDSDRLESNLRGVAYDSELPDLPSILVINYSSKSQMHSGVAPWMAGSQIDEMQCLDLGVRKDVRYLRYKGDANVRIEPSEADIGNSGHNFEI